MMKVKIPMILISYKDSVNFRGIFESKGDNSISLSMNFPLVKKNNKSHIKMIISPESYQSFKLLIDIEY